MTDSIEQKALALVNAVEVDRVLFQRTQSINREYTGDEALCRAIEQHEAFRQEVSDAVVEYFGAKDLDVILAGHSLASFIIAKPDPLVEVLEEWINSRDLDDAASFRAAIEKRGGKIVWGEE